MKHKFWTRRNLILVITGAVVACFIGYYLYARAFAVLPDVSVALMDDVLLPEKEQKILIFTPHPDDETIACAGYILRAVELGAQVKVVMVTDGNRRGFGPERHEEFKSSLKILGLTDQDYKFLDLPEYYLKEKISEIDLSQKLKAEIDNFTPTVVFYPDQADENPDHNYIGQTIDKLIGDSKEIYHYKFLVHYPYFPQPIGLKTEYNLTPPVKLVDFSRDWQRFMLSDDEENKKYKAISIYKSQLRTPLLHNLMMSMVRKNELFVTSGQQPEDKKDDKKDETKE